MAESTSTPAPSRGTPTVGAPRRLLVVLLTVVLQAAALLACLKPLASFDAHTRSIARAIVQEPRPSVGSLVPEAIGMLVAAALVLVASLVSWIVSWAIARRLAPTTGRRPRRRLLVPVVAAELVLAAAMSLTPSVVGPGQYAAVVVALPTAAVLAATMLGAAVALGVVLGLPEAVDAESIDAPAQASRQPAAALPAVAITLAIVSVALAALLVVPMAANRPIADDYRYFANIRGTDLGSFLGFHLRTETGRYTQGALMWLAFQVFGPLSVRIVPWILIGAIAAALLGAIRVLAPAPLRRWSVAVPLATTGALLAVLAVPSIPDSVLWLSSSTVYLTGVIGWTVAVTCLALAWRASGGRRAWWTVVAAVAAFLAQGCYEAMSALGLLIAIAAVVVAARRRSPRAGVVVPALVVLLAAVIGLAIIGLAPSVRTRATATAAGDLLIGGFGAVFTDLELWHGFTAGQWVVAGGLGLVLAIGLASATRRTRLVAGWVGAVVLTVVPLACGAISFLGLGWAPIRTYTVPALAFAVGFALVVGAVLAPLWGRAASVDRPVLRLVPVAGVVALLAVGGGLLTPNLLRLSEAVSLRAAVVDDREASVTAQLADSRDPIVVTPAPLLYYPAEARDFEFRAKQPQNWFWLGYKHYFGIPGSTALKYVTDQPDGYCVDDPRVSNPVVVTCAEQQAD